MARHSSVHPSVRRLVDDVLVPGFLATGGASALARAVGALAGAEPGQPHPARIAALLSDDPAKGVNDSTFELLGRAGAKATWASEEGVAGRLMEIGMAAAPHAAAHLDPAAIAELLSFPPAVIRVALENIALPPARTNTPVATADNADWSYQDVAVERAMRLLARKPHLNVGLVLPTGAGKTRTALRIVLERLAKAPPGARAIWIVHRHLLREQALRELASLVAKAPAGLPDDAEELVRRIDFVMISEVSDIIGAQEAPPALVVVDEAHHAAAPSYAPIFSTGRRHPVLLLTATPIRPDAKPIFIDEIAFTITYKELASRNAILIPTFEPLEVDNLDLAGDTMRVVAKRIADETASRFRKTLVITSRIDQVEALTEAVRLEIASRIDHPLEADDVGFIHGTANSHGLDDETMLALFAAKPRAVLVSAQMLLEGFDDPTIDSVVITYRTESMIKLMQAAGRCVRRSPGKKKAWVLQVDNPSLAYRFDERWLYQEISDRVRPVLEDFEYADAANLHSIASGLMERHNVKPSERARVLAAIGALEPDDNPRLMLFGLPYFGKASQFGADAPWGVFLETSGNSTAFRNAFNRYCAISPEPPDPTEFMQAHREALGLVPGGSQLERDLLAVLTATYFARRETDGKGGAAQASRGYRSNGATTWLRYVSLRLRNLVPQALADFLADCHNGRTIAAAFIEGPAELALVIKVPIPIGGFEAVPLDPNAARALTEWLDSLENVLRAVEPDRQLASLNRLLSELEPPPLPPLYLSRCEAMISRIGRERLTLTLIGSKE